MAYYMRSQKEFRAQLLRDQRANGSHQLGGFWQLLLYSLGRVLLSTLRVFYKIFGRLFFVSRITYTQIETTALELSKSNSHVSVFEWFEGRAFA